MHHHVLNVLIFTMQPLKPRNPQYHIQPSTITKHKSSSIKATFASNDIPANDDKHEQKEAFGGNQRMRKYWK